jgi:integrase
MDKILSHNIFISYSTIYIDVSRSKDRHYRIIQYSKYLDMTEQKWFCPNLPAYKDYLFELGTLQPSSIKSRVAAVRSCYRELLHDPNTLEELSKALNGDKKKITNCIELMRKAADPHETKFSFDPTPRFYKPLPPHQASKLLNAPDLRTLRGLRDTAIFAMMMFAGLRETEVSLLTVEDLHLVDGEGEIGIHVPEGPASSERFVPLYSDFPIKPILEAWLSRVGIQEGPVIRGFFRNERSIRDTPLTVQAIEDIFRLYPVKDCKSSVQIKPFDLRVFYARMLFALGYGMDVISQNLGVQTQTAVNYVGVPLIDAEKPPAFDVTKLQDISNTFIGHSLVEGSWNELKPRTV